MRRSWSPRGASAGEHFVAHLECQRALRHVALDRVPVEGKTGTAQVTGKADTSLFAAVAPADKPQFAVVAVVEEAGFGSAVAAPIVRRVLEVLTGATLR